ncbi:MAG: hypothetical protein U9O18_09960, partial [Chloroflexota bacterium]|nr:hypothetical protein [Chloroflexota bacterium]
ADEAKDTKDTKDKVAPRAPSAPREATEPTGGSLVAMPGEKLSRGAGPAEAPAEAVTPAETEAPAEAVAETTEEQPTEEGSGRRRRRRRGGRGRGRGGRTGEVAEGTEKAEGQPSDESVAASVQPDEVPTLPQHSGFGSVWDSQIGVPADSTPAASAEPVGGEDFDDEPEVPEYLLAEKKQGRGRSSGRGGRSGGRGGRSGGYRSALDRERYGSGSSYSRGSGRSSRGHAASVPRASAQSMEPIEQTRGGDPWSEVPPEVQALLKAEMARREASAPAAEAEEKPKKTTRKRTTKTSTKKATEAAAEEA